MKQFTCRNCGKPIQKVHHIWRGYWTHGSLPVGDEVNQLNDPQAFCEGGKAAQPREMCWYTKDSGEKCTNPVKPEDADRHAFACGVHMRKYEEDLRYQKIQAERVREQKEREEMAKWELTVYEAAYDRLHALDPELFPESERPSIRWRTLDNREIRVDVVDLERFVRQYVEATAIAEG